MNQLNFFNNNNDDDDGNDDDNNDNFITRMTTQNKIRTKLKNMCFYDKFDA